MKIFTCTDHEGFYPVGVASIIVAEDEAQARQLLQAALDAKGLTKNPGDFTLKELDTYFAHAVILLDGDY